MVTTVFSDEIVNATELRAKQSHWLTMAAKRPVTVTYGARKLTILNREKIRNLFIQAHYLELFVKHCNEVVKGTKSNAFPWIEHLDDEEKRQFRGKDGDLPFTNSRQTRDDFGGDYHGQNRLEQPGNAEVRQATGDSEVAMKTNRNSQARSVATMLAPEWASLQPRKT